MTGRIRSNEVATREGFQIEPAFVPTDEKVALIDALSGCGDARIEVTSFSFLVMSSSGPRAMPTAACAASPCATPAASTPTACSRSPAG